MASAILTVCPEIGFIRELNEMFQCVKKQTNVKNVCMFWYVTFKDRSKSAVLIAKRHSSVIRGSPCRS